MKAEELPQRVRRYRSERLELKDPAGIEACSRRSTLIHEWLQRSDCLVDTAPLLRSLKFIIVWRSARFGHALKPCYCRKRPAILRLNVSTNDPGQGPMVAFDAHDSCGRNSQVCRAEVAHTYEISRDEGVFQSNQHIKRSLRVDEHVWWIEERREWGRLVRHGLFQEIM